MKKREVLLVLIAAVLLAFLLSPFASKSPDGLEKVAEDKGFLEKAESAYTSPIPDYIWPGIKNEKIATAIAGMIGTLIVFFIGYGAAILIKNLRSQPKQ